MPRCYADCQCFLLPGSAKRETRINIATQMGTSSKRRGSPCVLSTRAGDLVFLTAILAAFVIGGSQLITFVGGFSFEIHGMTSASSSATVPLQWNHQGTINLLENLSHHGQQSDDSNLSSCPSRQQQHELTGFWRTPADLLEVQWKNSTLIPTNCSVGAIRFIVRGKPLPLKRHRTSSHKKNVYNPSAKPQAEFRQVVQEILRLCGKSLDSNQPLFGSQELLVMKLVFHMNRPKNHFLRSNSSKKNTAQLRKGISPWGRVSKKVDVDNLAKFVLDSLNGILYHDDQQIFSLSATKVYDNSVSNDGATYLHLHSIPAENEEEISQFMLKLLS